MAESLPITVLDDSGGPENSYDSGAAIIGLEIDILGKPVHLRIAVSQQQARLADIVPLARTICKKITDTVVEKVRSDGGGIPCHRGCSACCRYLVPLSVPEALCLWEEILAMPKYRRRQIQRACLLVARRILKQKPPKLFMNQPTETESDGLDDTKVVASWYANLKQPCSFLHKGICTIYQNRPLACREHFVKGSARACRGERGTAKVLEMPVLMVDALGQLAGELEGTSVEAVMMPLALVWCEENLHRSEQTWPAQMMVERFVEIVKAMASKNFTAAVA